MKIALLSDIHSNSFALEAVLNDIHHHRVDQIANLGDILYGPIAPETTYALLMQHDLLTLCGNQDRQLYEATPDEIAANPTMDYILNDLGDAPIEWLASLPFELLLDGDIYLCHGSPADDTVYLLEDTTSGYPVLRSEQEINGLLDGQSSRLIGCGHTHIPRTVMLSTGQLIINPGSVGLPAYADETPMPHRMQNHTPHASYAIIESTPHGWNVQQIKVPYNVDAAVTLALKNNRPDWAHYLKTGRAP